MASVGKFLVSPVLALAGAFKKPKAAPQPAAQPVATRNMAAEAAHREGLLRKRRGAGANELTGGGAEASTPGGKTLLGQ
ncbi:MAG TPA: hypothetical protein VF628_02295 [Allosphingosinicella sp.]|jgi:hypothetical protein